MNTKLTSLFLNSFDLEYDVVLLSETWLKPSVSSSEVFSPNYVVFRKDRLSSNGGGVLIAVSSKLSAELVDISCAIDIEFCCVRVKIGCGNIFFTCSYVPPRSNIDIYRKHIDSLGCIVSRIDDGDNIIAVGDFNLPSVSWLPCNNETSGLEPHSNSRSIFALTNEFLSLGLFQINNVLNINARSLDWILTDNSELVTVCRTIPLIEPEDL